MYNRTSTYSYVLIPYITNSGSSTVRTTCNLTRTGKQIPKLPNSVRATANKREVRVVPSSDIDLSDQRSVRRSTDCLTLDRKFHHGEHVEISRLQGLERGRQRYAGGSRSPGDHFPAPPQDDLFGPVSLCHERHLHRPHRIGDWRGHELGPVQRLVRSRRPRRFLPPHHDRFHVERRRGLGRHHPQEKRHPQNRIPTHHQHRTLRHHWRWLRPQVLPHRGPGGDRRKVHRFGGSRGGIERHSRAGNGRPGLRLHSLGTKVGGQSGDLCRQRDGRRGGGHQADLPGDPPTGQRAPDGIPSRGQHLCAPGGPGETAATTTIMM